MDFRSLEIFMEVATSGGFNRAAANLNLAQSAISRRILQLEHEIGTKLLERSQRGVMLTPAGSLLLEHSQALLRHFRQVKGEILAEASSLKGELAIGMPPSLQDLTAWLIKELRTRYPLLFVRVWVATTIQLRGMLLSGKLDFAIYVKAADEPQISTRHLSSEPLVLVALQPLGEDGVVQPWKLAGRPLLLVSQPNSVRTIVDRVAAEQQISLTVAAELNDIALSLKMVREGIGLAILPLSAMVNAREPELSFQPISGMQIDWVVGHPSGNVLSFATRKAIELVIERSRLLTGFTPPVETAHVQTVASARLR